MTHPQLTFWQRIGRAVDRVDDALDPFRRFGRAVISAALFALYGALAGLLWQKYWPILGGNDLAATVGAAVGAVGGAYVGWRRNIGSMLACWLNSIF